MIKTYKNLQDEVLRWLDEVGDTGTTRALAKDALRDAHNKRIGGERWPFMRWGAETLNIVSGQQTYALHPEFFRPFYFKNLTQDDYVEIIEPASWVEAGVDWNNDTGNSLRATYQGRTEVANQPLAASVIAVSSSNSADNGTATVTIRGIAAGVMRSETVTCNSSSALSFTKIVKVTKNGTWVGTMTLTSDAAAVTNLQLLSDEYGRSYQQIKLLRMPDSAESWEYDFYRRPFEMVDDNDRPDVPPPFEGLLVWDTLLSFSAYNQYDAGVVKRWTINRDEQLIALQQAYSDDEALEQRTKYIDYIPR